MGHSRGFVDLLTDALIDVISGLRGRTLNLGGARQANLLVDLEGIGDVTAEVSWAEEDSQSCGILDGHASALALVGHHLTSCSVNLCFLWRAKLGETYGMASISQ